MEALAKTSILEFEFAISDFQEIIYGSGLTPVAGSIFSSKIERYFRESFFREEKFLSEQLSLPKNVARF